jgi:hypothetical protein
MFKLRNLFTTGLLLAFSVYGESSGVENVIIRVAKPYDKTVAAIQAAGGRVTHQFKYVDALSAQVPLAALPRVRAAAGVVSMGKDVGVQSGPTSNSLESRLLAGASSLGLRASSIQLLSAGEVQTLSSPGVGLAGFNYDNTLLGLAPLFLAGNHGEGVIVAVIDSGIRPGVFHMPGSVIGGEDFVGDGLGWSNDANNGHGTFVAGMIAAHINLIDSNTSDFVKALNAYAPGAAKPYTATESKIPLVGTAPFASIYALRIHGPAGFTPFSRILEAIERVIQLREMYDAGLPGGENIRVCNLSVGGPVLDPGLNVMDQAIDAMLAHDIVAVAAAGNSGPAPVVIGTPATARGALTVGGASLAANERVAAELILGPGKGILYRPFAGPLMYFASSRGPQPDGQVHPHVVAPAHWNFGMGEGEIGNFNLMSGTSGAAPMVAGVAAVLRQAFPAASARQIRNAIIQSADPNFVKFADVLDQGHGFVNAEAAANLLAAGAVPDTLEPPPNATSSVKVNVEQNSSLRVEDGFVQRTFHLKPGQRGGIVYRVAPNTSQVVVSVTNFQGGPPMPPVDGIIWEDTLSFGIHSARTTDFPGEADYISPLEHFRTGTRIVNNPEPGLMRIAVSGSWRNAEDVSVDVSVTSLTDPIPQFTQQGQIVATQSIFLPFNIPAGTRQAKFRLAWRQDWGNFPTADIDLYLVSPSGQINNDGSTERNPENVTIQNPQPGNWLAMIDGFDIPTGSDKYELRIELDGKVVH